MGGCLFTDEEDLRLPVFNAKAGLRPIGLFYATKLAKAKPIAAAPMVVV